VEYTLGPLNITKELILSRTTEENLMEHYLGLIPKPGKRYCSPLRKDNNPTCGFYRFEGGDLIFKDFSGDFAGNFIKVVERLYNCSRYKALQIIANDIGIISREDIVQNPPSIEYTNTIFKETESSIIQVETQEFSQFELNYWWSYGIREKTLKKFRVYSCKNVWLNGKPYHLQTEKQLVFGYFDGIKDDIEQWRIYFPCRRKQKFISNWKSQQLQGIHCLPKEGGEYLVITKSLKDVMVLYEYGISAIAPISEHLFVTEKQYEKLKRKWKNIYLLYDRDRVGMYNAAKIRRKFPDVKVLLVPKKYKIKDISDFRQKYQHQKTIDLIEQTKLLINGKN